MKKTGVSWCIQASANVAMSQSAKSATLTDTRKKQQAERGWANQITKTVAVKTH